MSFYRSCSPINFDYNINGHNLQKIGSTVKDLDIVFDIKLKFYPHIESSSSKALKILGYVKRVCIQFKLITLIKLLYCALVRSVLEYGSVLFDPHVISHSYILERVQRKFLNFAGHILKIPHQPHDYSPVHSSLQLSSLADKRIQANSTFLTKLLSGKIDSPDLLSGIHFKILSVDTRFNHPFYIPVCKTNYAANDPLIRIMRIANTDPSHSLI
jgi:hypothetical protein